MDIQTIVFAVLLGAVTLLSLLVWIRCVALLGRIRGARRELAAQRGEEAIDAQTADAELRTATVRWMVLEKRADYEQVERLNFRADLRDEVAAVRTWVELLPVAGFFGTVVPVALALGFGESEMPQTQMLVGALATALITTAVGLAGFFVGAAWLASMERNLAWVERAALQLYAATVRADANDTSRPERRRLATASVAPLVGGGGSRREAAPPAPGDGEGRA